jgi:glycosyltransferase involved in cell wall biosynthesis
MKFKNNLVGILIMVKNEEESIIVTLESVKKYFKNIIISDTGSTDNTVEVIKKFCIENSLNLYLNQTTFKSFPESRNEAIEFSENIKVQFLLIMDAGDEFKTNLTKNQFFKAITYISNDVNYGLVTRQCLEKNENNGNSVLQEHKDYRLIRNNSNCRYDLDIPVHEAFSNVDKCILMNGVFNLYQNRIKYGLSTNERYKKDIELLLRAKPTKRNLYYLAQTYMNINDFDNGFKYNVLSIESEDNTAPIDEAFTYVRAGFCAIKIKKPFYIIFNYLEKAANLPKPPIDAFIYIFQICIQNNYIENALPYVEKAFNLEKPTLDSTLVNHYFYDFLRWNLISIICVASNKYLDIGREAHFKALKAIPNSNDTFFLKAQEYFKNNN